MSLPAVHDIFDEYELLDSEDRYRLLIELGRKLEPMPDALKTDATRVRGCSASVWVYPTTTTGIVALVLSTVQDRPAAEVAATDITAELAPFELSRQLSANRTQGVPGMIDLIRETAQRLAA